MDTSVQTLENTVENIAMLEAKGVTKSPVSKRDGMNKVIRYSVLRGVYWFTEKWVAKKIDNEISRMGVKTIILL